MDKKQLDAFLLDYGKVLDKHHLFVNSCGCCGLWVQDTYVPRYSEKDPHDVLMPTSEFLDDLRTDRWGDPYALEEVVNG